MQARGVAAIALVVALCGCTPPEVASDGEAAAVTGQPAPAPQPSETAAADCGPVEDVDDSPAEFHARALCAGTALLNRTFSVRWASPSGSEQVIHVMTDGTVDLVKDRALLVTTTSAQPRELAQQLGQAAVEMALDGERMFVRPIRAEQQPFVELDRDALDDVQESLAIAPASSDRVPALLAPLSLLDETRPGDQPGTFLVSAEDAALLLLPRVLQQLGGAAAVAEADAVATATQTVYPGKRSITWDLTAVVHEAAVGVADASVRDALLQAQYSLSFTVSQLGARLYVEPPSAADLSAGDGVDGG